MDSGQIDDWLSDWQESAPGDRWQPGYRTFKAAQRAVERLQSQCHAQIEWGATGTLSG